MTGKISEKTVSIMKLMADGKHRTNHEIADEIGMPYLGIGISMRLLASLGLVKLVASKKIGKNYHGVYAGSGEAIFDYLKRLADGGPTTGQQSAVWVVRRFIETVPMFTHADIVTHAKLTSTQATRMLGFLMGKKEIVRHGTDLPAQYMSATRAKEVGIDVDDDDDADADDEPTIPGARIVRFTSDGRFGSVAYRSMPAILCKPALGICSLEYI